MFETLAESPVTRAVGLALVHFVWQGAAIGLVAAWLLHALRNASSTSRYMIGCLALLAMTLAPAATVMRALSEAQQAPMATSSSAAARSSILTSPMPDGDSSVTPDSRSVFPWTGTPDRLLSLIAIAWSLGVLVLTVNLTGGWLRSLGIRRAARPVGDPWRRHLETLSARLGVIRRVVLTQSPAVGVPTLVGWLRPAIVVPASVLAGLTPAQLDAILAHELAHVRRHDYLVNLLQSVVETLLFYHPAVWWVSRRVRVEREHCCDDFVVAVCADRVVYARALASVETMRQRRPEFGLAATDGDLLQRVRRILGPATVDESRSSAWSVVAAAMVMAPMLFVGGNVEQSASAAQAAPPSRTDRALSAPVLAGAISSAPLQQAGPAQNPQPRRPATATSDEAAVLALEEEFRLAKIQNDVAALERLLDDAVVSTNQSGVKRTKADLLDLWRTFRVDRLTLDSADVQITGDLATVTGRQSEISGTGTDPMLFTRIWRRTGGRWRLFSVTQFFDPNSRRSGVQSDGATVRVGAGVGRPAMVSHVDPIYPQQAKDAGVAGMVIVELLIDESGDIADAKIIRSVPMLDQAVLDAVRQWKYQPAMVNGKPVRIVMSTNVTFSLQR